MPLVAYSARISYRGPHAFDVTRGNGGAAGDPFAPSRGLLAEAKAREKAAGENEQLLNEAFAWYAPRFVEEMRQSWRIDPKPWRALLARERVVLVCFCTNEARCHRGILRRQILPALGAVDGGEVPAGLLPPEQVGGPWVEPPGTQLGLIGGRNA